MQLDRATPNDKFAISVVGESCSLAPGTCMRRLLSVSVDKVVPAQAWSTPVLMLIRNSQPYIKKVLPRLMEVIDRGVQMADQPLAHFYFYENNSVDGTREALIGLHRAHPTTTTICLDDCAASALPGGGKRSRERCAPMAAMRNALAMLAMRRIKKSKRVLLIDTNVWFSAHTIATLLQSPLDVATPFALNGRHYYDTFALVQRGEDTKWAAQRHDCLLTTCTICSKKTVDGEFWPPRQLMPTDTDIHPVASAFGGVVAVNPVTLMRQSPWSSSGESEHVAFCRGFDVGIIREARAWWSAECTPKAIKAYAEMIDLGPECIIPKRVVERGDRVVVDTMYLMFNRPPPTSRATDTVVVLFAWNRPDYLERSLKSLQRNLKTVPHDVIVFVDGGTNYFSRVVRSAPEPIDRVAALITQYLPNATVMRAEYNYGVGLMQFFALHIAASLGYQRILMCEDDLVLGDAYFRTVDTLATLFESHPNVAAVQGGYRKESDNPNDIKKVESYGNHIHYWGWMTTLRNVRKIMPMYTAAAVELFWGADYAVDSRPRRLYANWYRRHDREVHHFSQDWVRDACFQMNGMTHKIYCGARKAAPIGVVGLHSNKRSFIETKLDSSTADIHGPPPTPKDMVINGTPVTPAKKPKFMRVGQRVGVGVRRS